MAKNVLKAWLVDNTVTTDDKTDKIFSLETTRSIGKDIILDRMVLGTKKRTYRQSLFRADFFYQKSAQPDNRPGSERNNYGFVRLRHPFHAGCRTLQVA